MINRELMMYNVIFLFGILFTRQSRKNLLRKSSSLKASIEIANQETTRKMCELARIFSPKCNQINLSLNDKVQQ